ncbi:transketolase [Microlunatus speluncae]|uniref:transketolase n=1 Tax=Microlunatus speluncae TaxID=2594267 RepID=UPI001266247B|nr:transketolase [Microlunatus speluncae]
MNSYADLDRLLGLMTGDEKHGPSATSTLDVLWVLYDRILNVTPQTVDDPGRDRFLLSKGHGPMAYYAVLAAKGFLAEEVLPTFGDYDSPLGHHPDRLLIPGVEISSGSLGHGLPISIGLALGLRARAHQRDDAGRDQRPRVITLIGDAEFDEGSNIEAVVYAGAVGLANLTTVVVDNHSSSHGWRGGIASRFAAEGWRTHEVSGRDHEALATAFAATAPDRPTLVVADVEPKG